LKTLGQRRRHRGKRRAENFPRAAAKPDGKSPKRAPANALSELPLALSRGGHHRRGAAAVGVRASQTPPRMKKFLLAGWLLVSAGSLRAASAPPVPLFAGLGSRSRPVTTRSAEAQRYFAQGLAERIAPSCPGAACARRFVAAGRPRAGGGARLSRRPRALARQRLVALRPRAGVEAPGPHRRGGRGGGEIRPRLAPRRHEVTSSCLCQPGE
jgi:hypothetical protein